MLAIRHRRMASPSRAGLPGAFLPRVGDPTSWRQAWATPAAIGATPPGERDRDVLAVGLDDIDAAIVAAILDRIRW